jgi:hypothetical protein
MCRNIGRVLTNTLELQASRMRLPDDGSQALGALTRGLESLGGICAALRCDCKTARMNAMNRARIAAVALFPAALLLPMAPGDMRRARTGGVASGEARCTMAKRHGAPPFIYTAAEFRWNVKRVVWTIAQGPDRPSGVC